MDTLYWTGEYIKLLAAFILLMFVWPSVVFAKHLKNKDKTYRFCFCATVQVLIVTTVVLALGLCHILNRWVVFGIFYGIFAFAVIKKIPAQSWRRAGDTAKRLLEGTYRFKTYLGNVGKSAKLNIKKLSHKLKLIVGSHLVEYAVLVAIIVYAVIYFTYGVFQNYGYGFGDMYVHHQWIDGMLDGHIFYRGIYPQAMHCFIYCLHVLFGIKLYSCVMLLGDVQIIVTVIAAYLFLKQILRWKYAPFFAIALFLTVGAVSAADVHGMSRFQWTLPQEFGMYTEFLAPLFFVRYLRSSKTTALLRHAKKPKYTWNENLVVFAAAVAASVAIHFYCTVIALLLLIPFVLFNIIRLFNLKKFVPLAVALMCGFAIAVAPMAIGFASGTPLQGSLNWATKVMRTGEEKDVENIVRVEQIPDTAGVGEKIKHAAKVLYWEGYVALYGKNRANLLIGLTLFALVLWGGYRLVWITPRIKLKNKKEKNHFKDEENYFNGYLPVITASVLFMFVYVLQDLKLPQIIAGSRICSLENLLLMSVAVMPIDMIFALICEFCREVVMRIASVALIIGIYVFALFSGTYRGYLLHELTRYNAAVAVTESIINSFPPNSYTIVSCASELYQVSRFGRYEEMLTFVREIDGDEYFLPTEYVFIFVEKRPLEYAQSHFFTGPEWLAENKYSELFPTSSSPKPTSVGEEVLASVITAEDAQKSLKDFKRSFSYYKNLEQRTILQSKTYQWCLSFMELFPFEMNVYYEDDNFVCYYFKQNPQSLYNLAIEDWDKIGGEQWAIETGV